MKKLFTLAILVTAVLALSFSNADAVRIGGGQHAKTVKTNTANFDGELSATEDTVQKALDALDDVIGVGDTTETNQDDA